eukprot:592661-Alexandrium_andersonii.AAC.1
MAAGSLSSTSSSCSTSTTWRSGLCRRTSTGRPYGAGSPASGSSGSPAHTSAGMCIRGWKRCGSISPWS